MVGGVGTPGAGYFRDSCRLGSPGIVGSWGLGTAGIAGRWALHRYLEAKAYLGVASRDTFTAGIFLQRYFAGRVGQCRDIGERGSRK